MAESINGQVVAAYTKHFECIYRQKPSFQSTEYQGNTDYEHPDHLYNRWHSSLLPALLAPTRHACLVNRYADPIDISQRLKPVEHRIARVPWVQRPMVVLILEEGEENDRKEEEQQKHVLDGNALERMSINGNSERNATAPLPSKKTSSVKPRKPGSHPSKKNQAIAAAGAATSLPLGNRKAVKNIKRNAESSALSSPGDRSVASAKNGKKASLSRPWPSPIPDLSSVKTHYLLDLGSLLCVEALGVEPGNKVLDMCAAPGGKSLAILQKLCINMGGGPGGNDRGVRQCVNEEGMLVANEPSQARRARLRKVLMEYLPCPSQQSKPHLPSQITLTSCDLTSLPSSFSHLVGTFDRVLVDAPCSSDRHVLHACSGTAVASSSSSSLSSTTTILLAHRNPSAIASANAKRQRALLTTALHLCKLGGRVVYSTCALSPAENDGVVERVCGIGAGGVWGGGARVRNVTKEVVRERVFCGLEALVVGESTARNTTALSTSVDIPAKQIAEKEGGWIVLPDSAPSSAPHVSSSSPSSRSSSSASSHDNAHAPFDDARKGWGPLYFCVLEKVGDAKVKLESDDGEEEEEGEMVTEDDGFGDDIEVNLS